MSKTYDGVDFFKMMAANEKAVGDLYRLLAGNTKLGVKFFENLAKDEDRHQSIYAGLLKKHPDGKDLTVAVSEEDEQYLKLLVGNNMLKEPEKILQKAAKFTTRDDVFDLAERAERDSILFVEEVMHLFPNLQPEDFKVVLQEEKKHLSQVLSRRMESQLSTLRL